VVYGLCFMWCVICVVSGIWCVCGVCVCEWCMVCVRCVMYGVCGV
jgi:hypothetical protein